LYKILAAGLSSQYHGSGGFALLTSRVNTEHDVGLLQLCVSATRIYNKSLPIYT
jgi:hypothetical protein